MKYFAFDVLAKDGHVSRVNVGGINLVDAYSRVKENYENSLFFKSPLLRNPAPFDRVIKVAFWFED